VQNEPNLALPQVGDGGDCTKRTQFRPVQGVRRRPNVQNEPNWGPPQVGDGGDCAKRTQFPWPRAGTGGESCKTNPIWPYRRWVTGRLRETNQISPGPRRAPEAKCAKRTQFAPAAGRQEFSLKAFALMMVDWRLMMEMGAFGEGLPLQNG
jgi:hypothetical protein